MFRHTALACGAVLVVGALFLAMDHRTNSAKTMTEAANHLLVALSAEQKAKAVIDFSSDERQTFFYTPVPRKGLQIREMEPYQKRLAEALLSSGLSQSGFIKATTIMSLEDVLRLIEKDDGERRNPEKYYVSIFGTPAEKGTWGWRFEGHHLSLNYTLVDGKVVGSPTFFGDNPGEVRVGPRAGLRALKMEEELARDLLASLTPAQKKIAILSDKAPDDMLTKNDRKAVIEGKPTGLSMAKMTPQQRGLFNNLLDEYVYNLPDQLALDREAEIRASGNELYFTWLGSEERGQRHYYRVQAPKFLIEYDNTQNDANHIHCIWRDLQGDWGLDLLGAHLKADHSAPGSGLSGK